MARAVLDLVADIRAAGAAAMTIAGGMDVESLVRLPLTDDIRYRALENALFEIGEAIRMMPSLLLAEHPSVDWRGFVGLRNIVTHQYFGVEAETLHVVVNEELPDLLHAVAAIEAAYRDRDRYDSPGWALRYAFTGAGDLRASRSRLDATRRIRGEEP